MKQKHIMSAFSAQHAAVQARRVAFSLKRMPAAVVFSLIPTITPCRTPMSLKQGSPQSAATAAA